MPKKCAHKERDDKPKYGAKDRAEQQTNSDTKVKDFWRHGWKSCFAGCLEKEDETNKSKTKTKPQKHIKERNTKRKKNIVQTNA